MFCQEVLMARYDAFLKLLDSSNDQQVVYAKALEMQIRRGRQAHPRPLADLYGNLLRL